MVTAGRVDIGFTELESLLEPIAITLCRWMPGSFRQLVTVANSSQAELGEAVQQLGSLLEQSKNASAGSSEPSS